MKIIFLRWSNCAQLRPYLLIGLPPFFYNSKLVDWNFCFPIILTWIDSFKLWDGLVDRRVWFNDEDVFSVRLMVNDLPPIDLLPPVPNFEVIWKSLAPSKVQKLNPISRFCRIYTLCGVERASFVSCDFKNLALALLETRSIFCPVSIERLM